MRVFWKIFTDRFLGLRKALILFLPLFAVLVTASRANATVIIEGVHLETPLTITTWKFHFGDNPAYADPSFDDSSWDVVQVPQSWVDPGHPQYGWYRLKFFVAEELKKENLAISLGRVGDADAFYLNGVKINETGSFPPHFRNINHKWRVYEIPSRLLNFNDVNTVALQVYKEDYHQQGGGLFFGQTEIGDFERLHRKGLWDYCWTTVKSIVLAILILFIFYDLVILWRKFRQSKELLFLGISALFFALISLCQSRFLYEFDFKILHLDKLNALSLFWVVYFQGKFFQAIFCARHRWFDLFNIAVASGFSIVTLFLQKSSHLEALTQYWMFTLPVFFGYWFFLTFSGLRTKRKEALTILSGLSLLFIFSVNDCLAYFGLYVFYDLVPIGFFGLVLSMRHALAHRFSSIEQERERANRWAVVGQASSELAHEIKNSLNPLHVMNENFERHYSDPDFRKDFQSVIKEETTKITTLVRNLLDFAGSRIRPVEIVKIRDIIESALREVDIDEQSISVESLYDDNNAKVLADRHSLIRAFSNLFRNAKEAMNGRGKLTIQTQLIGMRHKCLQIDIQDTGRGMTQEVLSKIFEPFYTTKDNGTGYGLSIVYNIIRTHKGQIRAQSRPQAGTTFTIILPLANPQEDKI